MFQSGVLQPGVLTTRGFYKQLSCNKGFLQQGVLQPGVLKTRGFLQAGVLTTIGLTTRSCYNQGFLEPGVLTTSGFTTRGSYNQGYYNQQA